VRGPLSIFGLFCKKKIHLRAVPFFGLSVLVFLYHILQKG
jgi:hypothetical protein